MKASIHRFDLNALNIIALFAFSICFLIYSCKGAPSDEATSAIDSLKKEIEVQPASVDSPTPSPEEKTQEILNKQFNNNKPLERSTEGIPLSKDGKVKVERKSLKRVNKEI
jgi:hypothetical protein